MWHTGFGCLYINYLHFFYNNYVSEILINTSWFHLTYLCVSNQAFYFYIPFFSSRGWSYARHSHCTPSSQLLHCYGQRVCMYIIYVYIVCITLAVHALVIHYCWGNHMTVSMIARMLVGWRLVDTLWPRQNCRHFIDDIETTWVSLRILLKSVHKVRITIIPVLVQIMPWRRPGNKPLSGEIIIISSLTHLCVTRP